ncbi:hypothetical protein SAY87_027247 [Trapa incisa]|uniref:Uncharacterized protein n=1 Tax=Trapa incisa TaxID=236973 RepID=A0AAN7JMH4_9MYRT|nr:hypothetical protein SAY87_027247 [Trapa incisa]
MALLTGKTPAARRNYDEMVEFYSESESLSDYFFGFSQDSPESSSDSSHHRYGDIAEDEEEEGAAGNSEEKKAFWESQEQLLHATLCRRSSFESKIRQATKLCLTELDSDTFGCRCRDSVTATGGGYCRNCLRSQVCNRLLQKGFSCCICKSKWGSSQEMPPGEHTYLEVVDGSDSGRGAVRVIIELNFGAEFEMARASEEYKRLTRRLPEVFVGKDVRLRAMIRILCAAAKKCMKERKIHMGPWRKHKYVQAKWFSKCERSAPAPPEALPKRLSSPLPKPRSSLLTVDFGRVTDGPIPTAVEVV